VLVSFFRFRIRWAEADAERQNDNRQWRQDRDRRSGREGAGWANCVRDQGFGIADRLDWGSVPAWNRQRNRDFANRTVRNQEW
jgi:hypothetical protein